MEVVVKPSFEKDIRKCPLYIQQDTKEVIEILKAVENLQSSNLDYQKCQGRRGENYYRIRVGDWRIGVELKHPSLIIITILTRGQVYKRFPPQ
ncbi:MAG: hypothetical protein EPN39_10330 [Chitinophagaceae bacterium]|nr:MAG: hypothetical protein EPN39_10330 [Chitinophagaceae bacterium]